MKGEFEKFWAGNFSLLSCTIFGVDYMQYMKKQLGCQLTVAAFLTTEGYTYCYNEKEDRRKFGEFLVHRVLTEKGYFKKLIAGLREKADSYSQFLGSVKKKEITKTIFYRYMVLFHEFIPLYTTQRAIVDYIPPNKLNTVFEPLQESRKYTENTLKETQDFIQTFAERLSKKLDGKIGKGHILSMTLEEVGHYFNNKVLPKKEILEDRWKRCALVFSGKTFEIKTGRDASRLENELIGDVVVSEVKGMCAYGGVVRGIVRLVFHPDSVKDFKSGEVIVTGMTRPEFLPLMKKAAAFVTDAGGITCHASIVSRELKIPTIVGTKIATKVFRDGDRIEVDAVLGIVRKLK